MRLRPYRRSLIVWSSSDVAVGGSGDPASPRRPRRSRGRRIRWWLRTGALLMVIGVLRLARTTRTRWEPVSLGVGALLTVIGFMLPSVAGMFMLGLLVLTVTLVRGIREQQR